VQSLKNIPVNSQGEYTCTQAGGLLTGKYQFDNVEINDGSRFDTQVLFDGSNTLYALKYRDYPTNHSDIAP